MEKNIIGVLLDIIMLLGLAACHKRRWYKTANFDIFDDIFRII